MGFSFSAPKGVRTRSSREFLYNSLYAVSGSLGQSAGHDSQIILANTDQNRWIYVYGISCVSNFIVNLFYFTVPNLPAGATLQTVGAFATVCDGAPGNVSVYSNYVVTPVGDLRFPFINVLNVTPQQTGDAFLAVVKPGYFLITQGTGDQITGFSFLQAGP